MISEMFIYLPNVVNGLHLARRSKQDDVSSAKNVWSMECLQWKEDKLKIFLQLDGMTDVLMFYMYGYMKIKESVITNRKRFCI